MTIEPGARRFLAAAPLHLAAWGLLAALGIDLGDGGWWLLLVGFVGFTITGFAWHLFPSIARRKLAHLPEHPAYWAIAEGAVVLGVVGRGGLLGSGASEALALTSAIGWLVVAGGFAMALLSSARGARRGEAVADRPGDRAGRALFALSWPFGVAAATLWTLAVVAPGPGLGWWFAGVHAFLTGQVALLIFAVSLRILPRAFGADAPGALSWALGGLAIAGAAGMTAGMVVVAPNDLSLLGIPGGIEALAAALFLVELVWLAARARTPRAVHAVYPAAAVALLVGGGVGLAMVEGPDLGLLSLHATTNVLGFVGLTILGMWFSMIAPFQFLSHAVSRRALGIAAVLLAGSILLTWEGFARSGVLGSIAHVAAGGCVALVGLLWAAGSWPVLYPRRR